MRSMRNSFQFSDFIHADIIAGLGLWPHRRWFIHLEWEKRHWFMEALELLSVLRYLRNGTQIKEILLLIEQRTIYTLLPSAFLENGACTNTSLACPYWCHWQSASFKEMHFRSKRPWISQRFNDDRRNQLYQPSTSKLSQHHLGPTTSFPLASIPGANTPIISSLDACETVLVEGNLPEGILSCW